MTEQGERVGNPRADICTNCGGGSYACTCSTPSPDTERCGGTGRIPNGEPVDAYEEPCPGCPDCDTEGERRCPTPDCVNTESTAQNCRRQSCGFYRFHPEQERGEERDAAMTAAVEREAEIAKLRQERDEALAGTLPCHCWAKHKLHEAEQRAERMLDDANDTDRKLRQMADRYQQVRARAEAAEQRAERAEEWHAELKDALHKATVEADRQQQRAERAEELTVELQNNLNGARAMNDKLRARVRELEAGIEDAIDTSYLSHQTARSQLRALLPPERDFRGHRWCPKCRERTILDESAEFCPDCLPPEREDG